MVYGANTASTDEDLWECPQPPFTKKEASRLLDKQSGFTLTSENLPPEDIRRIRSVTVRQQLLNDSWAFAFEPGTDKLPLIGYDVVICMEDRNDLKWFCMNRSSLFRELSKWGLIPR